VLKPPTARRRAILLSTTILLAAGVASGCDLQEDADLERGRQLFQTNCGTCHTLAEAGTAATVGPDLDASFAAARDTGMDQDTIEGVVQQQIANPRTINEENPNYDKTYMPADIVQGSDAEDVAAYVGSVAGIPGIAPPPLGTAQEVFSEFCGSCDALEAAASAGTTGPNLDEVLPGQDEQEVATDIRDPEAEIAQGFPAGVMPPFDENRIPPENLGALVEYLLACAGDPESDDCLAAAEETEAQPLEPRPTEG
jgi:mono/diheme cytochrome c family protein